MISPRKRRSRRFLLSAYLCDLSVLSGEKWGSRGFPDCLGLGETEGDLLLVVAEEEEPLGDSFFDAMGKENGEVEAPKYFAISVDDFCAIFAPVEKKAYGRVLPLEPLGFSK